MESELLARPRAAIRRIILPAVAAGLLLASCSTGNGSYNWGWFRVSPFTESRQRNLLFLVQRSRFTQAINRVHVNVFRSVPVLVMILWVYHGLPVS